MKGKKEKNKAQKISFRFLSLDIKEQNTNKETYRIFNIGYDHKIY